MADNDVKKRLKGVLYTKIAKEIVQTWSVATISLHKATVNWWLQLLE